MKPSTKSDQVYSYTLLIVESPSIARRIESFRIPYLEIVATGGYCWFPSWNTEKQTYMFRANPDQLETRKLLKEKSRWANKIIIATDSDPSGEFIAASVQHYLKSADCLRGFLHDLSPSGIVKLINNSDLTRASDSLIRLTDKKKVQDELKAKCNHLIPSAQLIQPLLVLADMFTNSSELIKYRYNDDVYILRNNQLIPDYQLPLNTLDVITADIFPDDLSFSDRQEILNSLFTIDEEGITNGLISYPRTFTMGYYRETLNTLRQQFAILQSNNYLPDYLTRLADPANPHDSIHVTDLSQYPTDIRPYVSKIHFELYSYIYKSTLESIKAPHWLEHFESSKYPSKHDAIPIVTISELGFRFGATGHIAASSFGKILDMLMDQQWITIDRIGSIEANKKLMSLANELTA